MPQYGEVRVDFITYTTGVGAGEDNVTVAVSGLVNSPTFSGNVIIGSGTVSGDLTVSGNIDANNINATGNVNISGNTTITGSLTVTGDTTLSGSLTVTGTTQFNHDVFIGSGLTVTGTTTLLSGLTVTGNTNISGDTTISGILTVTGNTNVSGALNVTGNISGNADGGVYGSGYWKVPDGTTLQRPGTPVSGMIRYNTTQQRYEGYGENGWDILGGGATGSGTDRVFILNETGVTSNYTLTGYNAVSAGAITIEDGIEVTIADTFGWSIV